MDAVGTPATRVSDPAPGTPARRPGSVRRTATTDIVRAGGVLHLVGRARDLLTLPDGTHRVLRTAATSTEVVDRVVTAVHGTPASPGTAQLVGVRAGSGFRTALDEALPAERAARSPLFGLLDDVPVTALISGYAVLMDAVAPTGAEPPAAATSAVRNGSAGVCAGWGEGGTMMLQIRAGGPQPVPAGPPDPGLDSGDPFGWHALEPLAPGAMRRHRRTDVVADPADPAVLVLAAMFRDSHATAAGEVTVLHEYDLRARVDRTRGTVLAAEAVPRVLPWLECPAAAASAGRLVGSDVADLRARLRAEFTGVSTCTHLTDALRSLEDVVALAADVPAGC